jgi:hypothetical protein
MTEAAEIERACSALVAAFPYNIDNRLYEGVVDLFAENGSFERPGVRAVGRSEIREMLTARPGNVATRHVCSQPVFLTVEETKAAAVTCFTLYQAEKGEGPFPTIKGPSAIAEYHDEFILSPDGWKIAARKVAVAMVGNA